jgi:hypothetical protein
MSSSERVSGEIVNGPALASFLAAGIGAFALGLIVLLNEVGLFSVPALYGPAGGVSGRTTAAAVIWLVAWAVLHRKWSERQLNASRVLRATYALVSVGVVFTCPLFWRLF